MQLPKISTELSEAKDTITGLKLLLKDANDNEKKQILKAISEIEMKFKIGKGKEATRVLITENRYDILLETIYHHPECKVSKNGWRSLSFNSIKESDLRSLQDIILLDDTYSAETSSFIIKCQKSKFYITRNLKVDNGDVKTPTNIGSSFILERFNEQRENSLGQNEEIEVYYSVKGQSRISLTDKLIQEDLYSSEIEEITDGYYIFEASLDERIEGYGIIRHDGEVLVQPIYETILFQENRFKVLYTNWDDELDQDGERNEGWGIINLYGETIIKPKYRYEEDLDQFFNC